MELRFSPLFSGSSGNAIYVGDGETNLLVDAGLSGSRITAELRRIGMDPKDLTAIITTHEHSDHTRGVGILSRKYHIPVYATRGTWEGMERTVGPIESNMRSVLVPGEDLYIGGINVMPFKTPHDANEPCGLCFDLHGARFSIATDVGSMKYGWTDYIMGSAAVLLESNYDPDMLKAGSYPYDLKRRILSEHGHLPNEEAAKLAVRLVNSGTRHIVLGHLSKENNFPELAYRCTDLQLRCANIIPGEDVRLDVASRDGVTGIYGVISEFE